MTMFSKVEQMRKQAEENRKAMPEVSSFVNEMKSVFGEDQIKVTYAKENGRVLGVKDTEPSFGVGKMVLTAPEAITVPSRAKNTRFK